MCCGAKLTLYQINGRQRVLASQQMWTPCRLICSSQISLKSGRFQVCSFDIGLGLLQSVCGLANPCCEYLQASYCTRAKLAAFAEREKIDHSGTNVRRCSPRNGVKSPGKITRIP